MSEQSQELSNCPNRFQQEAIKLVKDLVEVSSSVFSLLDTDMQRRGVTLFNLDPEVEKEYYTKFRDLDPIDPRRFDTTDDRVVSIDSQIPFKTLRQSIYYREFMQPHGHRYVADIFFRHESRVIAVLSNLRHESLGPFTPEELSVLAKLQPFLEYALNTVYLPKRIDERQSLEEKYQLTKRELDVVELVIGGASNKKIAEELALGLATVKTHLIHVYKKIGIKTRAELLSRIIDDLTSLKASGR